MARTDDKARFYVERAVPQLREFEAKEIFSKEEIRIVVRKKTEHERTILSPGSSPEDVLVYLDWEIALEKLRAKRCSRLKIRQSTSHDAQARIFQIFERGVSRHPGSGVLWRRYLDYANQIKATKRWRRVMTRALRILPGDGHLWVMAGQKASHNGDMETARSIFMRGCRFCTADPSVWIEFARVETAWLSALEWRQGERPLPASATPVATAQQNHHEDNDYEGGIVFDEEEKDGDDDFGSRGFAEKAPTVSILPAVIGQHMPIKLGSSSVMAGAIPLAIYDNATSQPFFGPSVAEAFFNMLASFLHVSTQAQMLQHILESMDRLYPEYAETWICHVKYPLLGFTHDSPLFPTALRMSLGQMQKGAAKTNDKTRFMEKCIALIDAFLAQGGLDEGIRGVLEDTRGKMIEV